MTHTFADPRILPLCVTLIGVATSLSLPAQVPGARNSHAMASSPAGVLMFGGASSAEPRLHDTLWQWMGAAWQPVTGNGPRSRNLPAMAVDSRRRVVVLYGGSGIGTGTRYGDTWEWDGSRWLERNVRTPGPRDHHAVAFDDARGNLVMYGGRDGTMLVSGTWTWDGSVWTLADSTSGPGRLVHHAMAYDQRRQRVVMHGGITHPDNVLLRRGNGTDVSGPVRRCPRGPVSVHITGWPMTLHAASRCFSVAATARPPRPGPGMASGGNVTTFPVRRRGGRRPWHTTLRDSAWCSSAVGSTHVRSGRSATRGNGTEFAGRRRRADPSAAKATTASGRDQPLSTLFVDATHPGFARHGRGTSTLPSSTRRTRRAPRPNVVLIITDDMGWADLGSYGATDIRTPNIDGLARDGVRLTDFYANGVALHADTRRTHLAALSAALWLRNRVAEAAPAASADCRSTGNSLPQLLKNNGYATALVGKWHLGYTAEFSPNAHGFDYFFGLKSGYHDYYTHRGSDGGRTSGRTIARST